MTEEKKLADVLMVNDLGEIAPRYNWREIFGEIFGGHPPKVSRLDYERWCSKRDALPKYAEFEQWQKMDDKGIA